LQISVSIADQEAIDLVLPKARARNLGVIAKRPIANAVWIGSNAAGDWYSRPYWERLRKLQYPFLRDGANAIETALRFTLSTSGVHSAIVGTSKPGRWQQNASFAAAGPLPGDEYDAIRSRWREVARRDWTGQR
jgi:aryl-alcohol dehydrogenase-like predicted oxidoreductase